MRSIGGQYLALSLREARRGSILQSLGGPDVTHLFVHCTMAQRIAAEIAALVPGAHTYADRALVLARPHDVVCVMERVDETYLQFLADLGIGPDRNHVVVAAEYARPDAKQVLCDVLRNSPAALRKIGRLIDQDRPVILNPFIASPRLFDLAAAIGAVAGRRIEVLGGRSTIVESANCKHLVRRQALSLGIPVADGETVELRTRADGRPLDLMPLYAAVDRHINRTGRVIVRGANGASGSSTWVVEQGPLRRVRSALNHIRQRRDNRIYLVESMFDLLVSPNVQMYVEPRDGSVSCVGVTDQWLNGSLVHCGNVYPSRAATIDDMIGCAHALAERLQTQGYGGLVGFDFGEYADPQTGEPKPFLAEANARVNGATYPLALMERLNQQQESAGRPRIEAFVSGSVKTPARSFAELRERLGEALFDLRTGTGVIPYGIACLKYGKCHMMVVGGSKEDVVKEFARVVAASRSNSD